MPKIAPRLSDNNISEEICNLMVLRMRQAREPAQDMLTSKKCPIIKEVKNVSSKLEKLKKGYMTIKNKTKAEIYKYN